MEMETRLNNDFIVNSKGHCFFCLAGIIQHSLTAPVKLNTATELESSSLQTLQNVSRYLKMDMTKVFSQKGSIPPGLLAKVEQSRLKAELCEECASLNKSFSVLFRQWEKLELEMASKLGLIQEKMTMAAEVTGRFVKSEEDEGIKQVVQVLRVEAMERCKAKLCNQRPRIKIQKLTRKEVNAHLIVKRKPPPQSKNDAPTEDKSGDLVWNEKDNGNGNADDFDDDKMDTNDVHDDDDSTTSEFGIGAANGVASTSKPSGEKNYRLNPTTGKYKCKLCSKEFQHRTFDYHYYKSVHLQIRYRCNLCEKAFSHKSSYNRHLRMVNACEKEETVNDP